MVAIKLPDGSVMDMKDGVNGFDVASKISAGLAKAALAVKVNGKVTIILKNYAPYIDKQTVKKLFEKFVRLDDKTTRTTRGTGLGLFIVKGLLSAMGGTIFIKSTPANEFFTYITLPSEEE